MVAAQLGRVTMQVIHKPQHTKRPWHVMDGRRVVQACRTREHAMALLRAYQASVPHTGKQL